MKKNDLKNMFTGYWNYLALNAACELKLFDKIHDGQNSAQKLITQNQWNAVATSALLNVCEMEQLVLSDPELKLTTKGEYLVSTNPTGLYHACLHWANEHLNAWQHLSETISTGGSSFEKLYGKPFFDYIGSHPSKLKNYHKAMFEYALDDYCNINEKIDFSLLGSVLDVGGGFGAMIKIIKQQSPHLRCGLFDLPEVITHVEINNIELHKGSFFDAIPGGFNAIILSRVLHDWDDQYALNILSNCNCALNKGGKLLVMENLADRLNNRASALTLNMMAMCRSFERTELEYRYLITSSGFEITEIISINDHQYLLMCEKL